MKRQLFLVSIFFLGLFVLPQISSAYLAPHNEVSNNIACEDCHILDRWGGGTPPIPYFLKPCEICHTNDTGSGYTRTSAPAVQTHSFEAVGASTRFGNWVRNCEDCHGHKFTEMPLATGTFDPTTGFSVNGGNTTFSVNFTSIDPKWDENDPVNWNQKTWDQKTGQERGLIYTVTYPDAAGFCSSAIETYCTQDADCPTGETCNFELKTTSFEIIARSGNSITVQGDLAAFIANPANPFPINLDGNFEIFYGQFIRTTVDGRTVIIADSTTFARNDELGGPDPLSVPPGSGLIDSSPNGICQVCHTQTNHWRNDGTGADHFKDDDCAFCHEHPQGFMPSCNTCHGFPPDPLVFTPAPTGSQTSGLHGIHVEKLSGRSTDENPCDFCHVTGMPVTPIINDPNGLQIDFNMPYDDGSSANDPDIYDGTGTSYRGQAGVSYDQTALTTVTNDGTLGNGSMTCSNIYCHSSGQSLIFGSQPLGLSPAWDGSTLDPDGLTCNNCHKAVPDNDLHSQHVLVRKFDCNNCHFTTVTAADYPFAVPDIQDPTLHVNGKFDVVPSPTYNTTSQTGLSNPFTYSPAPNGGTCFFPTDGTASCHSRFIKPLTAVWQTFPPPSFCGNGIVEGNEACDDNNNNDFDACSNACKTQTLEGPATDCTDADGDAFVDIADNANGCYVTGAPTTAPPYDECDNDPGKLTTTTYYEDADGDGFGSPDVTMQSCTDPGAPWVLQDSDCDDTDPAVNPDAGCNAVYFPAIKDGPHPDGLWLNFLTLCSVDPSVTVDLAIVLYNSNGSINFTAAKTIPANACLVETPNFIKHGALDVETFDGTIIIEAEPDKPIIAMTNSIAPNNEAFDIYEAPAAKQNHFFPAGFDNAAQEYGNILHIQNLRSTPVTVTVDYIDDILPTVTDIQEIPGHGEYEKIVRSVFGGDFNGSIRISTDSAENTVTAMLRYEKMVGSVVEAMSIDESSTERTALYYPYLFDGHNDYNNFISSINPAASQSVDCTNNYYRNAGTAYFTDGPTTIAAGARSTTTPCFAMDGVLTCDQTDEVSGTAWVNDPAFFEVGEYEGGMIGTCTGNTFSSTNVIKFANVEGLDFYESATPQSKMIFPQVFEENGFSNTLHLLNPNAVAVTVTITLKFTDGTVLGTSSPTIPPFGKHIMQPNTINTNPLNLQTNGSLTVDAGANTVAGVLVYELPTMITVYEGIATP